MGLACYILEQNRRLKKTRTRRNIPSASAIHGPLSGIATPAPPLADEVNSEMQAEDDPSFGALPIAQYAPVPPLVDEINSAVPAEDDLSFGALPTAQDAPAPPFANEINNEVPAEDDPPLSALSATHASARVAAWREKTLQERWNRSLEPIMEDFEGEDEGEDEDEEEEEEGEGPTADDDPSEQGCDEGEGLMESAPPGEEGISLWDLMGEHFIGEAMSIGKLSFHEGREPLN